jgi:chromosome segregation ATPase
MISGRQALGSIDQALNKVHEQVNSLQHEIAEHSERVLTLNKEQAEDYRGLARVRLGQLSRESVIQKLDHAEQQAIVLLKQRRDALDALHQKLRDVERRRQELEQRRQQQADRLDQAIAVVDEAEAKTQARLDEQPAYRAQRERAEQEQRMAAHADDKATRSEQERESKGQAYRDDPLFMYLWGRKYGMPGYEGGGLTRWLDGKVARLIGYADARANYDRLNEIPARLREHATNLKELGEAEFLRLRELDDKARAADGIPALEERVASEQEQLDDIDGQIKQNEALEHELLEAQSRHASGEDEQMVRAVEYLATEFERDDLSEVRSDAMHTPYPEDDVIVSRMLQRDAERHQIETTVQGLKDAVRQQQGRLADLEDVRNDFKRHRYDRPGSAFSNDTMLPLLLGQFLGGMLDRGMLWRVLQEQQHYRPQRSDPTFGSGGFGRGTVWSGGLGDLGDIFGGLGRGGGFGGGFGGGGFGGGGGGFRTGGGF